jgi:hypothetical protein
MLPHQILATVEMGSLFDPRPRCGAHQPVPDSDARTALGRCCRKVGFIRKEQHPMPIHPSGPSSPPRSIQDKRLIAISESRKPRRNSVRYLVNAG